MQKILSTKSAKKRRLRIAARLFQRGEVTLKEAGEIAGYSPEKIESIFNENDVAPENNILVCGGAGFIGSNFIHYILNKYPEYKIINYDKLAPTSTPENLNNIKNDPRYKFIEGDIVDKEKVTKTIEEENINYIVNFAAETHSNRHTNVNNKIVDTNISGVHSLLEATKNTRAIKRLLHISTDEVYGDLELNAENGFTEESELKPNSPYAASKAGGEMLCRAYNKFYNIPVVVARPSKNYGPFQRPKNIIPNILLTALKNKPIVLHGSGKEVRDWIFVIDNIKALDIVLHKGANGEVYNIGTDTEKNTYEIAKTVLNIIGKPEDLITVVNDDPGTDMRHLLDATKIKEELSWRPEMDFKEGVSLTLQWYKDNINWVNAVLKKVRNTTPSINIPKS